ncbi:hypothetical protein [Pelomonas sp. KK5]|uniref:hypothetical protein n=1 Tax=Pelomonas sp. KK5 TaxID=1855730 RepID=UPI00097C1630|nr:hypothetical protein [Pelomonas sp. KK5]
MKRILLVSALGLVAASSAFAAEGDAVAALRSECAAKYTAKQDQTPIAANEYRFVYAKGEFKGEQQMGMSLACTEGQYAAYLDSADPVKVMGAYPTAAGRPTAKDAAKK